MQQWGLHRVLLGLRSVRASPASDIAAFARSPLRQHARHASSSSGRGGGPRYSSRAKEIAERNKNMGIYLGALVVGMVGASYGAVPLYQMFCQAYGYGGTTQKDSGLEKLKAWKDKDGTDEIPSRDIDVFFTATTSFNMPWKFWPTQQSLKVRVGETALAFFTAKNVEDHAVTGVATYNVMPARAGSYFNKIQCFCFDEQRLRAGEQVDMPVFFFLDPELLNDRHMDPVKEVTLSYTFFPSVWDEDDDEEETLAAKAELDKALEQNRKHEEEQERKRVFKEQAQS